jgi:two-component system, sensor histidine kinase PdtaS
MFKKVLLTILLSPKVLPSFRNIMHTFFLAIVSRLIITVAFLFAGLLSMAQSDDLPGIKFQTGPYSINQLAGQLQKSKTNTDKIRLLVECGQYYIDQHVCCERPIDSAGYFLNLATKLNKENGRNEMQGRIEILSTYNYCTVNNYKDPKKIYHPLINNFGRTGDAKNEMLAWQYFRRSFIASGDTSKEALITIYEKLASLSGKVNHNDDSSVYRRFVADIHLQQTKFAQAENELSEIEKNQIKTGSKIILYTYDLQSALYLKKGEMEKALDYALKTEKTMQITGDSLYAAGFYTRIGLIDYILKDIPGCLVWARKAVDHEIATHEMKELYTITGNLASVLMISSKPNEALKLLLDISKKFPPTVTHDEIFLDMNLGSCYTALRQYSLAEKKYQEMIRLVKSGTSENIEYYNALLGGFYIKSKKYKIAKKYLLESLKDAKYEVQADHIRSAYMNLFRADSMLGDHLSAVRDLEQANIIRDSIYNTDKNKQIEELQISYQTAEKEKDIKLLEDKEKLERIQLQHSENTRNWIIAGSVMLLIIAGLLFRQSSLRKLNNKVITQKNQLLQSLVTEKEWLLKEVHHRVKNNLHTVICLLESQAAYLENDALKAIENSQHRIYAMSLIHQKLYQLENIKSIDMAEYLAEFLQYLSDSFGSPENIFVQKKIEHISLSVTQAIPLGLIINEAVTNAFKYAFPKNRKGEINISLKRSGNKIELTVADNGIGITSKYNDAEPTSLGIELMKGMTRDIKGNIFIETNSGTSIQVIFAAEHFIESVIPPILSPVNMTGA